MNVIVIVVTDRERNILKKYHKKVAFQLSKGLYVKDGIEGVIEDCFFENGVFEGFIRREHDFDFRKFGFEEIK